MKRFLYSLGIILIVATAFTTASCGNDDDEPTPIPTPEPVAFKFGSNNYYTRSTPELFNVASSNRMQLRFDLYKNSSASSDNNKFDLEAQATVTLELTPFNVMTAQEGTVVNVITSRGTWVEDFSGTATITPEGGSSAKVYFKPTPAEVTYLGYNTQYKKASFKINLTMANGSKSVKLEGTVDCDYTHNAYSIAQWQGNYPY